MGIQNLQIKRSIIQQAIFTATVVFQADLLFIVIMSIHENVVLVQR